MVTQWHNEDYHHQQAHPDDTQLVGDEFFIDDEDNSRH
jgi:hypothetical protein